MSTILVGIGEIGIARKPGERVKTVALGSCVALVLLESTTRMIGMAHVALPDSKVCSSRRDDRPGYFADLALPALMKAMQSQGCIINNRTTLVKLVGGANVMDPTNLFCIGKRNALALRKLLWMQGMAPVAEELGGEISRTVEADCETGCLRISTPGRPDKEI